MRYLPQPARADDHYELVGRAGASSPQQAGTLDRLAPLAPSLVALYRERIRAQRPLPDTRMSADESLDMSETYTRLRASGAPEGIGATVLLNSGNAGFRCCYCEIEVARHVDHFAPKVVHPEWALSIANLVPSCGSCNGHKQHLDIAPSGNRLPHPYLDEPVPDDHQFVFADVTKTPRSYKAAFRLAWPATTAPFQRESLTLLFERLHLLERYGLEATILLSEDRETITRKEGRGKLPTWARKKAASMRTIYGPNHFKTVLYQGLAQLT